jgi:type IV pilus assembly protein PilX
MNTFRQFHPQTGSALIISLVFLLLLTVLGLSAMQSSTLQERMAGNAAEKNRAFQLAEAALRSGELAVKTNSATFLNALQITPSDYAAKPSAGVACNQVSAWCKVSPVTGAESYYYVEAIPNSNNTFRITGLGYGRADTNRVVLQSTFRP